MICAAEERFLQMKQGAIFDMDGLMFDTEAMYQAAWNETAAEMGIELPETFVYEICGTSGDLLRSVIRKYFHTDDPDGLFQNVLRAVENRLKIEVPVKPGLFELLACFRAEGVKLAVASSSYPEMIASNLRVSGTETYFDEIVSGSRIEHGKPAPDIFLYAADRLHLDPKDCYVFEDSVNGVLAGLAAGCTTVMVPDYVPPTEEIRNSSAVVCTSLTDALERIKDGRL